MCWGVVMSEREKFARKEELNWIELTWIDLPSIFLFVRLSEMFIWNVHSSSSVCLFLESLVLSNDSANFATTFTWQIDWKIRSVQRTEIYKPHKWNPIFRRTHWYRAAIVKNWWQSVDKASISCKEDCNVQKNSRIFIIDFVLLETMGWSLFGIQTMEWRYKFSKDIQNQSLAYCYLIVISYYPVQSIALLK